MPGLIVGNIEIGHQPPEGCPDITVLDVQLGQPDARFGRLQPAVHVTLLRQQLLLLRQLGLGVLNRGVERSRFGDRLLILVGADEPAAEERFQAAGMGARISGVRPQPGDFSPRRCDRLLNAADLCLGEDKLAPRALQLSLVWPRVHDKQQIVLLDRLIVNDMELHERTFYVRRDPNHVCTDVGIIGARVSGARPRGHDCRCYAGDDDRQPDQPPENAEGPGCAAVHAHAR